MSDQDQGRNGSGPRSGGGGRRRRRRRGGPGGSQQQSGGGHSGGQGGDMDGNRRRRRNRRRNGQGNSGGGGGGNRRPTRPIEPFELFCAFLLGLDENKRYRKQSAREVARRFGCGQQDVLEALKIYNMDRDSLRRLRPHFDAGLSELDIKVAPEGIDRGQVALERYEEFIDAGIGAGLFEVAPTLALLTPEDESDNSEDPGPESEDEDVFEEGDEVEDA